MAAGIKKVLNLHLALLLFIMAGVPAYAQETVQQVVETAERAPKEQFTASLELLGEGEAYDIIVNNIQFTSDTDTESDGWKYTASSNKLELTDYSGASIRASGDLTIYSNGTCSITGCDETDYGGDGIRVEGNLTIDVQTGTLCVTGGSGNIQGGVGVSVDGYFECYTYGTSACFTGGQTYNSLVNGKATWGGDAVNAYNASFYGYNGAVTLTGGAGSTEAGAYGGCGVFANHVYLSADCTITGGDAYIGAPGIYFTETCNFRLVNATVKTGYGPYGLLAIYNPDGTSVSVHKHTTVTQTSFSFITKINQYQMILNGEGGTINRTEPELSFQETYPAAYDLSQYLFTKDGYIQVAWRTEVGDLLPLNNTFQPTEDTTLYAAWYATEAGDIVLNGLEGAFNGATHWESYRVAEVALPDVTYDDDTLLGWCTKVSPVSAAKTMIYDGQWFEKGEQVSADPESIITLYAQAKKEGQYVIYHANGGEIQSGGTILVQGTAAASSELQVITPDESYIAAPKGYKLAGWSEAENTNQVQYEPNTKLTLQEKTIQHLYAQWEQIAFPYTENGVTITVIPKDNKVCVQVPAELCEKDHVNLCITALYDDEGKMLTVISDGYQTGEDVIVEMHYDGAELPTCAVFLVDKQYRPMCQIIKRDLKQNLQ